MATENERRWSKYGAPRDEALAIPVLANLLPEEQSKLIQLAERFYSKNGWYRYRASN